MVTLALGVEVRTKENKRGLHVRLNSILSSARARKLLKNESDGVRHSYGTSVYEFFSKWRQIPLSYVELRKGFLLFSLCESKRVQTVSTPTENIPENKTR